MTDYSPVKARGAGRKHLEAFLRRNGDDGVLVAVPSRFLTLAAPGRDPLGKEVREDTRLEVGDGVPAAMANVLTGHTLRQEGSLKAAELFAEFPFAVLDFKDYASL